MPTVLAKEYGPNGIDLTFEVENGEVIYEALEKQGLELPHGCLAGSCGACRIEVISNPENLKTPSAVEADTISSIKSNLATKLNDPSYLEKNIRLSCRARVQGDFSFCRVK